ncbi:MAG: MFS transporter [Actinobacteria bacterium]|nr:MFS transporter [Actinomycetota bacterium]
MIAPYINIYRTKGAFKFSLAAFIARMPISMMSIAIVFVIVAKTDSYALAGTFTAIGALMAALVAPFWSRAADRYGQSRILSIAVPIHIIALLGFLTVIRLDAPRWSWFILLIIFEGVFVGTGQMVRRRWSHVLNGDSKLMNTAYSVESLLDEIVFMVGPIITTLCAINVGPYAGVLAAAIFLSIGSILFIAQKGTEPMPHPKIKGVKHKNPIFTLEVQAIFLPFIFTGASFAAIGLIVVAYADQYGAKSQTGLLYAIWALGSLIAAFINGAQHWKISAKSRYIFFTIALAIFTLPLLLAAKLFPGNLLMLSIALFLNGIFIAPLIVAGYTAAENLVEENQVTETLAWILSGLILGGALPGAITGHIIDTTGAQTAFIVPVIAMGISILTLIFYFKVWLNPRMK